MRFDTRYLMLSILAITLFVLGGCTEDLAAPVAETLTDDVYSKELSSETVDGVTTHEGIFGGENLYEVLVPENWNGELVVYAHGFVDAGEPLTLPTKDNAPEIRDAIVEMGFAWAWCSYRENGMAVKDGAWATRQLTKIFGATVKTKPGYTWLMGNSMGGLIAVELAETHAREFDGVVTLNGMIGGTKVQMDYVGHVRVLFDIFYPGVLPGSICDVPEDFDLLMDVVYPVIQAVQADPTGLGIISRIKQTPLPGRNGEEMLESLITALGFNFRGIHDVLDRTGGACPMDNMDTVYEAAAPGLLPPEVLDMINAAVQRYDRSIPTDELFDRYYEPTGELAIPMVSVHNAYDPVVHILQENLYAAKVAANGLGQNLDQRVMDRYAHTDFPAAEAVADATQALSDLRLMVITSGSMVYTD